MWCFAESSGPRLSSSGELRLRLCMELASEYTEREEWVCSFQDIFVSSLHVNGGFILMLMSSKSKIGFQKSLHEI